MLREQRSAARPTLGQVAAEVGVHPSRLAHEFRRRFGVTAGEYLRRGEPVEVIRDEHYRRVVRRREP
jgi:AraC-like DNA-binding protein